jgi:hypothetical protein
MISVKAVALTEGVLKTMFIAKLRIATTIVLSVGLLGISLGLYPTRGAMPNDAEQEAAPQPPSASAAPGKEGGNPSRKERGEKKIALPQGPAPAQALVSLTKEGKLTVKCEHIAVVAKLRAGVPPLPGSQILGPRVVFKGVAGGIGRVVPAPRSHEISFDLKEVKVLDTKGNEVAKKELPKLLKDETLAVAVFGEVDPLHLRILKEGTLIFVLPLPAAHALSFPEELPLPGGDEALLPELGPMSVSVLYYRKRASCGESTER